MQSLRSSLVKDTLSSRRSWEIKLVISLSSTIPNRAVTDKSSFSTKLSKSKERLSNIFEEAKASLSGISQNIDELNKFYLQLKNKKDELTEKVKIYEKEKEELIKSKIEKEKELAELNSNYELLKDLRLRYEGISSFRKIKLIFYEEPSDINKLIISLKEGDLHKKGETGLWELEVEAKTILFREEELKEKISQLSQQIEKVNSSLLQKDKNLEEIKKEWHQISNEISQLDKKLGEKIKEKDSVDKEFLRVKEEFDLLSQEIGIDFNKFIIYIYPLGLFN